MLDPEDWERLKACSEEHNCTMGLVISTALKQYLEKKDEHV